MEGEGRLPAAEIWMWVPWLFRCSCLILRSRRRKRTHTRSGTAAICPFKSIRRGTVLVALETGWQIGDGALIAEDHGHDLTGVRRAAEAVACALVVQHTEQDEGRGSGSDPPEMKAEVTRGWRLGIGKRRRALRAEQAPFKLCRRAARRPRAQLRLQFFHVVHKMLLSSTL